VVANVDMSAVPAAAAPIRPGYARSPVTRAGESASADSQRWLTALRGPPALREEALAELHGLLLRGARHELHRRRTSLGRLGRGEIDDLAVQAADDALVAILTKLDTFRGASRFTTWAYKFVLLEAGVKARRRAWQGREVNLELPEWAEIRDGAPPAQQMLEAAETLRAIQDAVQRSLTPHQREVFAALALNDVPIDVLAERMDTTRGALYKTLHDARRRLRTALADAGLELPKPTAAGGGR
jgi:RNA polymerase sigma-70 factor (ECF subfamily)